MNKTRLPSSTIVVTILLLTMSSQEWADLLGAVSYFACVTSKFCLIQSLPGSVSFYVCFSCLLHREPWLQTSCFSTRPSIRSLSCSRKPSPSLWPSISSPQRAGDPTAPCPRTKPSSCHCSTTIDTGRERGSERGRGREKSLWQQSRS